jgi:hypothetical protein
MNRMAILAVRAPKIGAQDCISLSRKKSGPFFVVKCTTRKAGYLAKRGIAPFGIPSLFSNPPISMPKGTPPADGECFADHFYVSQSREEKKKQKARYMARVYRKECAKYVNCALSFEEYAVLQERAKEDGCTPTAYLRKAAFAYLEQKPVFPKAVEIRMGTLVALLRNMASNLNQIARHANQLQKLTVIDALQARSIVFKLEKAVKEFIAGSPQKP